MQSQDKRENPSPAFVSISDLDLHSLALSFNISAGCARRSLAVCLDVDDVSFHLSDFAPLCLNDRVSQCANPGIRNFILG